MDKETLQSNYKTLMIVYMFKVKPVIGVGMSPNLKKN